MSNSKAAVEFRWSNPKALYEVGGTESGLRRLSETAYEASQKGSAQFMDDLGTSIHFVREDEIRPVSRLKKSFFSALMGISPFLLLFLWIPLAAIGGYTVWGWIVAR